MKKSSMNFRQNGLLILLAAAQFVCIRASAFIYHDGDLLLCFRQEGGTYDMVVNLGRADRFKAVAAGEALTIDNYSTNQLKAAFQDWNDLRWSVCGSFFYPPPTNSVPAKTVWVTSPRSDPAVPTTPYPRSTVLSQSVRAVPISSVGSDALSIAALVHPDPIFHTDQVLIEPAGTPQAYDSLVGPNGDFSAFPHTIEGVTSSTFTQDQIPSRCDFYELAPKTVPTQNQSGTNLGYFDLNANGLVTFHAFAAVVALPAPKAQIVRQNQSFALQFDTVAGATYKIHSTNAVGMGVALSQWPVALNPISGDGTTKSVTVDVNEKAQFFVIEASR
jgi:hypothetical protein